MSLKSAAGLLRGDGTYIIIGGTGGLGRSMAKWLSTKGAKYIVLVSRSGTVNEKLKILTEKLAPLGTQIIVKPSDVSSKADVERLVKEELKDLPPVRGVVHGAMVLRVS